MHECGGGDLDYGLITVYQVQMAFYPIFHSYLFVVAHHPFLDWELIGLSASASPAKSQESSL